MQAYQTFHLTFNCPKAFNQLQPCNGGWYCDGCHKMVHDFRGMNETDIRAAFEKSRENLCGMYDANRINLGKKQPVIKKWLSAALLTLGFNTLHQVVFAQNIDSITNIPNLTIAADTTKNNAVFGGISVIMPEYPGGVEKLQEYINSKLKSHPGFKGKKAIVTFIIEKDGSLSGIQIIRKIAPAVDNELVSLFRQSPKWHPAMQSGKPVKIQYSVPVIIKK